MKTNAGPLAENFLRPENAKAKAILLANIKSGKTTTVNAILGAPYLHTSNVVATCGVVAVENSEDDTPKLFHENTLICQGENISNTVKNNNENLRDHNTGATKLTLRCKCPCLPPQAQIVDSPGLNEAGNPLIRQLVPEELQSSEFVIVVLDYKNSATKDEEQLWKAIQQYTTVLQNPERLLCVINKVDEKKSSSLAFEDMVKHFQDKINLYVEVALDASRFVGISAQLALDAKMMLNNLVASSSPAAEDLIEAHAPGFSNDEEGFSELKKINWQQKLKKSNIERVENWIRDNLSNQELIQSIRKAEWSAYKTILEEEIAKQEKMIQTHVDSTNEAIGLLSTRLERCITSLKARCQPLDSFTFTGTARYVYPSSYETYYTRSEAIEKAHSLHTNAVATFETSLKGKFASLSEMVKALNQGASDDLTAFAEEQRDFYFVPLMFTDNGTSIGVENYVQTVSRTEQFQNTRLEMVSKQVTHTSHSRTWYGRKKTHHHTSTIQESQPVVFTDSRTIYEYKVEIATLLSSFNTAATAREQAIDQQWKQSLNNQQSAFADAACAIFFSKKQQLERMLQSIVAPLHRVLDVLIQEKQRITI